MGVLIEILKKGEPAALDQAVNAFVNEFWMRDVPDFDTHAQTWLQRRPAFVVKVWWTHPETRPVSQEGYWRF